MNVQLKYIDQGRKNLLETDKIVHVKVIERKGGNNAVIELNGYKTEALIEADVPDNFLAFAEIGAKQADQMSVKLRVLSSLRNSPEFGEYNRRMLMDSIKMFLMENNLPLDQEYYENALLLRAAGIKLNPVLLKLLHQAALKNSDELTRALIGFLKKGMVLDAEFIDFFIEFRRILKRMLSEKPETRANPNTGSPEINKVPDPLESIFAFFSKTLGERSAYRAFLIDFEEKEVLVQYRVRNGKERDRFTFELSGERTGENLLVIDWEQDSFRITVFMNPELYNEARERIRSGKEALRSSLQRKIPDRKILLDITDMKNPYAFWEDEEPDTPAEDGSLFNLDISV